MANVRRDAGVLPALLRIWGRAVAVDLSQVNLHPWASDSESEPVGPRKSAVDEWGILTAMDLFELVSNWGNLCLVQLVLIVLNSQSQVKAKNLSGRGRISTTMSTKPRRSTRIAEMQAVRTAEEGLPPRQSNADDTENNILTSIFFIFSYSIFNYSIFSYFIFVGSSILHL